MALSKTLAASGLAALALLATAGSAFAATAYATNNVNVRSGPGTYYGVVDTLRRGERVDVQQCRGSWCYVEKRGPDGWVSANYLSRGGGYDDWDDGDNWGRPPHWNPGPSRPPHWNPRPYPVYPTYPAYPSRPGASVCIDGPNGYFCVGN
ncbi:SH3 domain-containing protein [Devosia sp. FKR38]|uniref:SH3 domain-containing protein n=1 Tax=Devosia sp. FKR38 TaxID=2562312 RepID=UPI0014857960|nr:SH3 domain-containing protein [Devosia sp. FKR38]